MATVFINYRRAENKLHAQIIYQHLIDTFKNEEIFLDTEDIAAGELFPERIKRALQKCKIMISIIGEKWAVAQDPVNPDRPHPEDWVGAEIALAIKRGMKIIPILVESAKMPQAKYIPKEISAISLFNAINIKFNQHTDNGIEKLKATINGDAPNIKKKTEPTLSSKIEDAVKITTAFAFAVLLAFSNPTAEDHIKKIQRGFFSDWKLYKDIFYKNQIVFSTTNTMLNNQEVILSYGFLGLIIESKEYEKIQQEIGIK